MLIDSNIILEMVFNQAKSKDCKKLINAIDERLFNEKIYITRFALSAIEAMSSGEKPDFLRDFLLLIHEEKLHIFELSIADELMVNSIHSDLGLDFDDAVQYIAANKLGTYLVTFDKDFKNKGLEIKTPEKILKEMYSNKKQK